MRSGWAAFPMPVPPVTSEAFACGVEKIARFRGQTIVVKLGGSAMEDPAATDACLRSIAVLNRLGVRVALVHGGGKLIDRAMAKVGLTPKKVAGRRYTDDATLAIVVEVLCDTAANLYARLKQLGGDGFPMESSLIGERLMISGLDLQPIDLGHVGTVTKVREGNLIEMFDNGLIPIVPSLARDESGGWLNINADTAASAIAGELQADKAIFLTDTPGVLRDRDDPKSLLPKLSEAECRALIASGAIAGGMIPKVEACFEALAAGAKSALILDGREPFSLLDVFLLDSFSGTEITK